MTTAPIDLKRRAAALKAWRTRRARGRPRLPRVSEQVEVGFPLRGVVIPMRVTVDLETQLIRFKAPGERHVSLALWFVYEQAGGGK